MKNQMMSSLFIFATALLMAFRPAEDPKKLLVRKWKVNEAKMKPFVKEMIKEMAAKQGATLPAEQQSQQVDIVWGMIGSMTIDYKADGTFEAHSQQQGDEKGKWTLSADGRQLTTPREGKPTRDFKIITLTETLLELETGQPQIPRLFLQSY
jgi:hypothetical protein